MIQSNLNGTVKKITAKEVLNAIKAKFNSNNFMKMEEFEEYHSTRRADLLAISLVRSRPGIHGIEIKVNRSDWLKELNTPKKADAFYFCDYFYLAAPAGLWQNGEVPEAWGILEYDNGKVRQVKDPLKLDARYDFTFLKTLLGRILRPESAEIAKARSEGYSAGYKDGEKSQTPNNEVNRLKHELGRYQENFEKFKANSGIEIDSVWDLGEIGKIVRKIQLGAKADEEFKHAKERIESTYERLGWLKEKLEQERNP